MVWLQEGLNQLTHKPLNRQTTEDQLDSMARVPLALNLLRDLLDFKDESVDQVREELPLTLL